MSASRDASVVYAHLQETQQRFDGRALDAFLAKYIRDPDELEQVRDRVLELHQQDYERLAGLNRVVSGWRRLGVQDLALELSPGYAAAERRRRKL